MLSCSKLLCELLSSDLHPSGSVNRIRGHKKVILAASGEGWVEQSPLGVCPLFANLPRFYVVLFYLCYSF